MEKILGPKRFSSEKIAKGSRPGVVTGLAWTGLGGDILLIETIPLKGKGFKLTGQLGDVMNESATIAYSYIQKMLQDDEAEDKTKKTPPQKTGTSKRKSTVAEVVKKRARWDRSGEEDEEEKEKDGPDKPKDFLSTHEVHLHLPAGAVPKDGPSAGITMGLGHVRIGQGKKGEERAGHDRRTQPHGQNPSRGGNQGKGFSGQEGRYPPNHPPKGK